MWSHIFYLLGLIGFFHELRYVMYPEAYMALQADTKKVKDLPQEETMRLGRIYFFVLLPYILWSLIGVFTNQWILFVMLQLLGYLKSKLLKKARLQEDIPSQLAIIRWDAFVSAVLIALIIIRGLNLI